MYLFAIRLSQLLKFIIILISEKVGKVGRLAFVGVPCGGGKSWD